MKVALAWSLLGAAILAGLLGEAELGIFLALGAIVVSIADVEVRRDRTEKLEAWSARARERRRRT